jgi:aspartate kinase
MIDVAMKFGGSSLADKDRIDHVANLIKDQIAAGYRPRAVVCSAMGKTTNALLAAGEFALGTYQTYGRPAFHVVDVVHNIS